MKRLKTLSLVTENCEIFTFDAKHIGRFDYDKINRRILWNELVEYKQGDMAFIGFNKNAEVLDNETQAFSNNWNTRTDITIVDLVYDDYSVETIHLEWPDGEENRNLVQHPGQKWYAFPNGVFLFKHSMIVP